MMLKLKQFDGTILFIEFFTLLIKVQQLLIYDIIITQSLYYCKWLLTQIHNGCEI